MAAFKPRKTDWLLVMGFADAFEYSSGKHPTMPDDEIPIEQWVVDTQHVMHYIEADKENI